MWWENCHHRKNTKLDLYMLPLLEINLYDFMCFKMGLIKYPELRTQIGKYKAKDPAGLTPLMLESITNSVFRKFCILLNSYNITVQERQVS